jgi:hypothetical protein
MQAGTFYRYFRVDADHDISTAELELSTDKAHWSSTGVEYVALADLPARPAAITREEPPADGMGAYWFRRMTGPDDLPIPTGMTTVYGRLVDADQTPRFAWSFVVGPND